MALREETVIDQISVSEHNIVMYREANRVYRDDEKIAETLHRYSLTPGQDLTGTPAKVVAICNAVWTQEIIDNYLASLPK